MTSVSVSSGAPNLTATYYGAKRVLGKKRKYSKTARAKRKVEKTMGEFSKGTLHSGSKKGPVVKSRKQAIAISLSQARKEK